MSKHADTSRINGAASHGPTTPGGKARSSQNALKHGLSSKKVLLPTESAEEFAELRDSYFDTLKPSNPLEAELVETLAATRWRLRRLSIIEANLFNNYILENAETYLDDSLSETGDEGKLAWAFKGLSSGNALTLLVRYEGTLTRTYDRTFKQLQTLQKAKLQNEPEPPHPSTEPRPSATGQTVDSALPQKLQNEPEPEPAQPEAIRVHPVHPIHLCDESTGRSPEQSHQSTPPRDNGNPTPSPPAPKV